MLIAGAERWIGEALDAWSEGDQPKVTLMAPMAVELLGKAALWRENPVLLVQLNDQHETSLVLLATHPDLATKGVKTVGLQIRSVSAVVYVTRSWPTRRPVRPAGCHRKI
jgi:hypothetical protein